MTNHTITLECPSCHIPLSVKSKSYCPINRNTETPEKGWNTNIQIAVLYECENCGKLFKQTEEELIDAKAIAELHLPFKD